MPKRPSLPKDPSQRAKAILEAALSGEPEKPELTPAQEFARSGGLRGGPARSEKLTPAQRREIAEKAAKARWGQKQK